MKFSLSLLAGGVVLGLASMAQAASVGALTFARNVTIGGNAYKVYNLTVTDATGSFTNAHIDLNLTAGSIFKDSNNGLTAPAPIILTVDPDSANDTFVTIPQAYPNVAASNSNPATATQSLTIGTTSMSGDWFAPGGSTNSPNTAYIIAQITVTANAAGSVTGTVFDTLSGGVGTPYAGTITPSLAPEPASLGVLALGGLALLARRRKA